MSATKELVGIPYALGARGPDSFDCFGFVEYMLHSRYRAAWGHQEGETRAAFFRRMLEAFEDVEGYPRAGDVLFFESDRIAESHLAWVEGRTHALEAVPEVGVCRTPLSELLPRGPRILRLRGLD